MGNCRYGHPNIIMAIEFATVCWGNEIPRTVFYCLD